MDFNDLISHINTRAKENNIKLLLEKSKSIFYPNSNLIVNGYFDIKTMALAVAIDKPLSDWIMLFAHESSHMDQWIDKCVCWNNSIIDEFDSTEYIDKWISGEEFSQDFVDKIITYTRDLELDCERRTIEKAKFYNLPVNITEEIQKANSYIYFYTLLRDFRKWSLPEKSPYQLEEVWRKMPESFDVDHSVVSNDLRDLYFNHCYS